MGASDFMNRGKGKTAQEAFNAITEQARYEDGHGGYTGTIAEKSSFKMVTVPPGKDPREFAEECLENDDHWCQDKWGPAACILVGVDAKDPSLNVYCFFGFASS